MQSRTRAHIHTPGRRHAPRRFLHFWQLRSGLFVARLTPSCAPNVGFGSTRTHVVAPSTGLPAIPVAPTPFAAAADDDTLVVDAGWHAQVPTADSAPVPAVLEDDTAVCIFPSNVAKSLSAPGFIPLGVLGGLRCATAGLIVLPVYVRV